MPVLIGIATHSASHAELETMETAQITLERGVARDFRGRPGRRQVSVLSKSAWDLACADAGADLHWTTRRANLLVDDIDLANTLGRRIRVGGALLEITMETDPCERMEEAYAGLRKAMEPDWRGGVCCRVIEAGTVQCGDTVTLEAPDEDSEH